MGQAAITDENQRVIDQFLRQEVAPYGYVGVDVVPDEDHDGDPILRVFVHYDGAHKVDPRVFPGLMTRMRDLLWERQELRFPMIRHCVPDDALISRNTG